MSNYEINPCKACLEKYQKGDCDINTINNCCYDTLTAFSGRSSVDAVRRTEQAKNCVKCVQDKMKTIGPFGKTFCDLQLAPPPIWSQSPHYVPGLLNQGYSVGEAKQKCLELCEKTRYPNECKSNCLTDASAVVMKESYENPKKMKAQDPSKTYSAYAKEHPVVFYLSFIIIALLLALVLVSFLRTMIGRKLF